MSYKYYNTNKGSDLLIVVDWDNYIWRFGEYVKPGVKPRKLWKRMDKTYSRNLKENYHEITEQEAFMVLL